MRVAVVDLLKSVLCHKNDRLKMRVWRWRMKAGTRDSDWLKGDFLIRVGCSERNGFYLCVCERERDTESVDLL